MSDPTNPVSTPFGALLAGAAPPRATVEDLAGELDRLTDSQREWVSAVIKQFQLHHSYVRNPGSDLVNQTVLDVLGDALRIHHAFSRQALSKDRFEFALERALSRAGIPAVLATSRTNRGHDLTINGAPVSLKTEAASNIKANFLHISKFMELGRGPWEFNALREGFFQHMTSYDRIFQFRCLGQGPGKYEYELVEIPKQLLLESTNQPFVVCANSLQSPKPGYCRVADATGERFALYFDGGTERKLQIKNIRKSLCTVHATWQFDSASL
ncbi:restriction endonuclease [Accumulibacter sp.]|uniref:restriction endonuclease n=1 Tax=Accumulibacter sp. TaxID=2053492 RepID=UPI002634936B|nr:restriction endonuclease [Accumulibacter sp.]